MCFKNLITFLVSALFFTLSIEAKSLKSISGSGPELDRIEVLSVLKVYLTVTDNKNRSAIKQSFHPTAFLMSVNKKGSLISLTQDLWWERVSKIPDDQPERKSEIVLIDVSGHAAVARIDITNGVTNTISTDYLNLQKLSSGWRIVNKTLSVPL